MHSGESVSVILLAALLGPCLGVLRAQQEDNTSEQFRKQYLEKFPWTLANTTAGDAMMLRILVESNNAKRGIEVGHIFKLGTKYSEAMKCEVADPQQKMIPLTMGCYGLGIGRTVAAAVEQNHDDDGIIWPVPLAPYTVALLSLQRDKEVLEAAEKLYTDLKAAGVEVFWDDRDERPGVKFKDADLIGFPVRVVIGGKALAKGVVEVSTRREKKAEGVAPGKVVEVVKATLAAGAKALAV